MWPAPCCWTLVLKSLDIISFIFILFLFMNKVLFYWLILQRQCFHSNNTVYSRNMRYCFHGFDIGLLILCEMFFEVKGILQDSKGRLVPSQTYVKYGHAGTPVWYQWRSVEWGYWRKFVIFCFREHILRHKTWNHKHSRQKTSGNEYNRNSYT